MPSIGRQHNVLYSQKDREWTSDLESRKFDLENLFSEASEIVSVKLKVKKQHFMVTLTRRSRIAL